MPATKPVEELKARMADLIIERISKTSVSKVADDLQITRQAVYDFRAGKYCPSLAVIQRACTVWNIEFNIQGLRVDQRSLPRKKTPTVRPVQARLFEALELLQDRRFQVKTRRTKETVELVFRLKISA